MPYRDTLLREKIQRHGERAARRVEGERPETPAEATQRQNPKMLDISNETILGLNLLETLTT